jgi:hypothetical protein
MTDPFILPVPRKLAEDPELGPYFLYLHKTLHDLTVPRGTSIEDPAADVNELQTATVAILEQLRADGTIAT